MILGSFRVPKSMQHEVRNGLGNRIVDKRAQDRQKTAPRRRKTPQGLQVGADLDPRGVPKSIQNRLEFDLGRPRGLQSYPGPSQDPPKTLPRPKIDPKSIPNRPQIDPLSTRSWNAKASWSRTKIARNHHHANPLTTLPLKEVGGRGGSL